MVLPAKAKKHLTAWAVKLGEEASTFIACPDKIIVATEANCISFSSVYGFDFYQAEIQGLVMNFDLQHTQKAGAAVWPRKCFRGRDFAALKHKCF